MKVICILPHKTRGKKNKKLTQAFNSIVVGHTYTVVFEVGIFYELEEFPAKRKGEQILWDKNCFVPLEDDNYEDELCEKLEKLLEVLTKHLDNN
ncbi:MAG: hypothetical protein QM763_04265 [Agriterribacter sp.]